MCSKIYLFLIWVSLYSLSMQGSSLVERGASFFSRVGSELQLSWSEESSMKMFTEHDFFNSTGSLPKKNIDVVKKAIKGIRKYIPAMAELSYGIDDRSQNKENILFELCQKGQKVYFLFDDYDDKKLIGYAIVWKKHLYNYEYSCLNYVIQSIGFQINSLHQDAVCIFGVLPRKNQKNFFKMIEKSLKNDFQDCKNIFFQNLSSYKEYIKGLIEYKTTVYNSLELTNFEKYILCLKQTHSNYSNCIESTW